MCVIFVLAYRYFLIFSLLFVIKGEGEGEDRNYIGIPPLTPPLEYQEGRKYIL